VLSRTSQTRLECKKNKDLLKAAASPSGDETDPTHWSHYRDQIIVHARWEEKQPLVLQQIIHAFKRKYIYFFKEINLCIMKINHIFV